MSEPVVLLMTDIVDSTRLTEELGDRATADLWEAHDQLVRALAAHGRGTELQRSDGFLMRFDRVDDAIEFAIAYHRELPALPEGISARVGIHVGALEIRSPSSDHVNGHRVETFAGLAIPMTARIMSLASSGQTLISAEARAAFGPSPRRVLSHGHWRLKGIADPLEIFEVGGDDAPFAPPPDAAKAYRVVYLHDLWLPRREVPHSLPAERNSFVGRRADLDDLARRLDAGARLISVVGMGGTGKTRLVQHFGWLHLGDFPGGIWYCDLSQATTFDGVCLAVAQGLDIPLGKTEPVDQLGNAIAGHAECLIVLDNFEQIAEHARKTLGRWLDRAMNARFVVTTRIVLGLDGEEVLTLPPMGTPEGVALFEQRAKAIWGDMHPSRVDEALLTTLVELLDGLPLAIELAAARVRVFSVSTLVERMRDRFKLLTSGQGRPSRQAALRATLDWSWELLSEADKSALAQLSVFDGGFTIESAESVLEFSGVDERRFETADLLQSLLDKSWIIQISLDRFGLLKTIQQYAAEQLVADGRFAGSGLPKRLVAEQRHWEYFGSLDEVTATAGKCVEIDNLVTAARRATARVESHAACEALSNSWSALKLCGPYRVAIGLTADVLALPDLSGADRAAVQFVLGNALQYCGRVVEAAACYVLALEMARECGAKAQEVRVLCAIGEQHTAATRHDEAHACLADALRLAQELCDERLVCNALNALGNLHLNMGELRQAQERYDAALLLAKRMRDRRWEGGLLGNLGGIHHAQGRTAEARSYYERAIAHAQEVGDKRWESNARSNLGLLLGETGDLDGARKHLEASLASARELGHFRLECIVACNLGMLCEKKDDLVAARDHFERALLLAEELGDRRTEGQTHGHFGLLLSRMGHHADARAHLTLGVSILSNALDSLSLAALQCQFAESECLAGNRDAALARWQEGVDIAKTLDVGRDSTLRVNLDRVRRLIDSP